MLAPMLVGAKSGRGVVHGLGSLRSPYSGRFRLGWWRRQAIRVWARSSVHCQLVRIFGAS